VATKGRRRSSRRARDRKIQPGVVTRYWTHYGP
jgi:hypothetical protein